MEAYIKGAEDLRNGPNGGGESPPNHLTYSAPIPSFRVHEMAKTPRLKFYGIALNFDEARQLAQGAGMDGNPAKSRPKTSHPNEYTWLPYNGRYLNKRERFHSKPLPKFYELGLVVFDKKERCAVWTALGARWMMRFARLNDHVRFGHTRKYVRKEQRRHAKTKEK